MNETTRMHKFTPDARQAIAFAQQEAERLEHNYIGTEHLLLGLLDEPDCKAAHVLTQLHVDAETVRQRIQTILNAQQGNRPGTFTFALGRLGAFTIRYSHNAKRATSGHSLTRRAQKCIHFAVEETERRHAEQIGSEQLLSGIVREGEGLACKVLESMGVDLRVLEKSMENA